MSIHRSKRCSLRREPLNWNYKALVEKKEHIRSFITCDNSPKPAKAKKLW